jgi:hypothetical protein
MNPNLKKVIKAALVTAVPCAALLHTATAAAQSIELVPDGHGGFRIINPLWDQFNPPDYASFQNVAIDSQLAVAGQPNSAGGAAQLFTLASGGLISPSTMLPSPSDLAAGDEFGSAVAVAGGTVVVGAHGHASGAGAAYVFAQLAGGPWTLVAELAEPTPTAGDAFGHSVAISGDVTAIGGGQVIVGAPGASSTAGEAYMYSVSAYRPGTSGYPSSCSDPYCTGSPPNCYCHLPPVTIPNPGPGDPGWRFGFAVSVVPLIASVSSTPMPVIGAPGANGSGTVYAFGTSPASGSMTLVEPLTASDGASGDLFGASLSSNGSAILVGAKGKNSGAGVAYFFNPTGSTSTPWAQAQEVSAPSGGFGGFGASVALGANLSLVGAQPGTGTGGDTGTLSGPAAAYVLSNSGSWAVVGHVESQETGGTLDPFGSSVALSGNTGMAVSQTDAAASGQVVGLVLGASAVAPALGGKVSWLALLLGVAGTLLFSRKRSVATGA